MRICRRLMMCCIGMLACASLTATAQEKARPMGGMKAAGKPRAALALGAAFAPDGKLWVSGLDEDAHLFIQSSADSGATWNPRQILETEGDAISADGENRPKIAFGSGRADGVVVIAYTKPLAKPFTGDIRMLRSGDGGKTFSPPFTVHDDRQQITHRFESIAFDRKADLYVTWVDKRDLEAAPARESGGKRSSYQGAAIYGKVSKDGGKTFGADLKLADHSCECCRIAMVDSPQSGMVAMWRHVFEGSIRDHGFASLSDLGGNHPPARATEDGWVLAGCPHHGPGLANASPAGFHSVWFGLKDGKSAVRYGRLSEKGLPVGKVRELPDDKAEHADVVANGKSVAIAWRSFDGERTNLRAWVSTDDGVTFTQRELAATTEDNDHPRMLTHGGNAYAVWRTNKAINVYKISF
ncbi:MAG: exo-alpha-sialidase [Betaproteobacteria bacterium]|nr:exo-alpha-sialidase [Betaproteobacteria bacterium]